jgi:hypothetical protein
MKLWNTNPKHRLHTTQRKISKISVFISVKEIHTFGHMYLVSLLAQTPRLFSYSSPLSYFHLRIKRRSLDIEICSCSSSDWTRIVNNGTIVVDKPGSHRNPRSLCTDNNRLESSIIGSWPPECHWRHVNRDIIVPRNSIALSWASVISC